MIDVKKILVAIDLSNNSDKLLQEAIYFAKRCEAKIVIVYVLERLDEDTGFDAPYFLFPEINEDELQRMPVPELESMMRQRVEEEIGSLIEHNLDPEIAYETKLLTGEAAEKITEFANQESIDLILMGTHGYKGFNELVLGSQAHKVLRIAPCPVITNNYNKISS